MWPHATATTESTVLDANILKEALELAGTGLKATDSAVAIAQRLKALFQSPQPAGDDQLKPLLADLVLEVADAKLANADLKFKLTQALEAQGAEEDAKAKLAGYVLHKTEAGGIAYAPKDLPEDAQDFHLICPTCFEENRRTILQLYGREEICPRCDTKVVRWNMRF